MRFIMLATAAAGLCACATASQPPERSAQAQASYERMLAGKTAGDPIRCLPSYRSNDMTAIDDGTILFRDGSTVYVNQPIGQCSRLGNGGATLVTRTFGGQLCRGDLAQVVDLSSGMMLGSCAIGDFTPYRPG